MVKFEVTNTVVFASTVEGIQQGVVSSGREFAWQGEPPNTSTTANTNYTFWGLTDNPYKLTDKSGYPYMRKYYEDRYKYYTVLGCEWELTVTNVSEEPGADAMVGHLYTNEIKPPNEALPSNVDTESKLIPGAESMYWKGIKHDVVNSDKGNNGLNNQVTIRGKFKTGQSRSEIATDDKVETWTERHFTPKLQEDLTLMFFKHPAAYCHSTAGPYLNCYLRMKYIVQWKELTSALKYISNAEIMGEPERSVWRNTAIAYDTVETAIRDTSVTGTRNDGNRAQYTREAALTDDKVDDNEVSDLVQSS